MTDLIPLQPYDEHNRTLESNVHPLDWVNPEPRGRYHLVVVGAGTAGLVTAAGAAGMGANVALVERELMGGDCLNVGCVPSKALLAAARTAGVVRDAGSLGVQVPAGTRVDFVEVMQRMRKLRAGISPHDSAERFRSLGVDVFLGDAAFTSDGMVEVAGKRLAYRRAVICTGARAAAPDLPGLDQVDYLTNESLFSLTELPPRLLVLGGGPIGVEMAQSFARFGSQVTLIDKASQILVREETDAAEIVQRSLERDGVRLVLNADVQRVVEDKGEVAIDLSQPGGTETCRADRLLVAIGRAPNVEGLGLDNVGVDYDLRMGVRVDDRLRTTNRRIFAAGDVCSQFKFTHAADFMARLVIRNALFLGRGKASALTIPWSTYTSPELARVGWTPDEARRAGVEVDTFTQPLASVDRAILEGNIEGFVRAHVKKGTDKIVGATIVASHAGEMIGEMSLAMTNGLGLKAVGAAIHPYPTQAEAIRKLGDQYNRTRLTPTVKKMFQAWLAWTR